ncbi:hypothetical protein KCU88_g409, partial [Aureobasidium melanogenum]
MPLIPIPLPPPPALLTFVALLRSPPPAPAPAPALAAPGVYHHQSPSQPLQQSTVSATRGPYKPLQAAYSGRSDPADSAYSARNGFMAKRLPHIGDITFRHIITQHTRQITIFAQPALFQRQFKAALVDGMFGQLAHFDIAQLVNLRGDRILFDQGLFGERELQRVVGRQGHVQALFEVTDERVAVVENVLDQRDFAEHDAVRDAGCHVGEQVVNPVPVWWVLFGVPFLRGWEFAVQSAFHFAFVVDAVEADDSLQKDVYASKFSIVFIDL